MATVLFPDLIVFAHFFTVYAGHDGQPIEFAHIFMEYAFQHFQLIVFPNIVMAVQVAIFTQYYASILFFSGNLAAAYLVSGIL